MQREGKEGNYVRGNIFVNGLNICFIFSDDVDFWGERTVSTTFNTVYIFESGEKKLTKLIE